MQLFCVWIFCATCGTFLYHLWNAAATVLFFSCCSSPAFIFIAPNLHPGAFPTQSGSPTVLYTNVYLVYYTNVYQSRGWAPWGLPNPNTKGWQKLMEILQSGQKVCKSRQKAIGKTFPLSHAAKFRSDSRIALETLLFGVKKSVISSQMFQRQRGSQGLGTDSLMIDGRQGRRERVFR